MAFEIEFYKTKDGKEPVVDFLDSLDDKMAAKLVGLMEVLEEKRYRTPDAVFRVSG